MCAGCSSREKQRTPAAMVSWSCFDAQKGEEQNALWTVVEPSGHGRWSSEDRVKSYGHIGPVKSA